MRHDVKCDVMGVRGRVTLAVAVGCVAATGVLVGRSADTPAAPASLQSSIKHVVVVYQENHSFDHVLGLLCVEDQRCDGTTTGVVSDGSVVPLQPAPDIITFVGHTVSEQTKAIDGGKMDAFDKIIGCKPKSNYACYQQFEPEQIPNLAALARKFVISDRTFEDGPSPTWGSHLELAAAQLDGFDANGPNNSSIPQGLGLGCDSGADDLWQATPKSTPILVPACVPKPNGTGPYRPSPVPWIPTIMDRLQAAGLRWHIYAPPKGDPAYGWAVCPVFADCLYTAQAKQVKPPSQVITDAQAGKLPRFSIVLPEYSDSQHNNQSMLEGDNWIGSVVAAIMNGPDWSSTAIFVTYDDCGCFYDHVPPPPGLGIRVPMVIVSPYVKPGFTDSTPASYASMLAFVEHAFGLAPLTQADATAYDYSDSFDFGQAPVRPIHMSTRELPARERTWLRTHPAPRDST